MRRTLKNHDKYATYNVREKLSSSKTAFAVTQKLLWASSPVLNYKWPQKSCFSSAILPVMVKAFVGKRRKLLLVRDLVFCMLAFLFEIFELYDHICSCFGIEDW